MTRKTKAAGLGTRAALRSALPANLTTIDKIKAAFLHLAVALAIIFRWLT